ncbi:MAG: type IV pilus modification PilV family protein [Gammaproteobacteria bacterium]
MNSVARGAGQGGFSLLEILVAFSILSLSLTALLNIFSSGIRNAIISEEYSDAVQIAQSLMASAGVETQLTEGITQGSAMSDKYFWQVAVVSFDPQIEDFEMDKYPVSAYRIRVRVSWGEAEQNPRSLDLETLKLAPRLP